MNKTAIELLKEIVDEGYLDTVFNWGGDSPQNVDGAYDCTSCRARSHKSSDLKYTEDCIVTRINVILEE